MKKKKGKVLKRILIVLGILFVLFGVFVGFVIYDMEKQEELLTQEVIKWSNKDLLKDDFSISIETKGDYAYVENAVKKFYKQLSDNVKTLYYYLDNEELSNILTVDNLQNDKPNFVKSKQLVNTVKANATSSLEKIASLCEEEKVKNLLDKDKVDDYYVDLYRQLMYTEQDLKNFAETKSQMEELSTNLNLFLDKIMEILNMLERNSGSWFIEGGQIYFQTNALVDEYNRLYTELSSIANDKLNASHYSNNSDTSV